MMQTDQEANMLNRCSSFIKIRKQRRFNIMNNLRVARYEEEKGNDVAEKISESILKQRFTNLCLNFFKTDDVLARIQIMKNIRRLSKDEKFAPSFVKRVSPLFFQYMFDSISQDREQNQHLLDDITEMFTNLSEKHNEAKILIQNKVYQAMLQTFKVNQGKSTIQENTLLTIANLCIESTQICFKFLNSSQIIEYCDFTLHDTKPSVIKGCIEIISAVYQNLNLGISSSHLEFVMNFLAKTLLLNNWRIQARAIDVLISLTNQLQLAIKLAFKLQIHGTLSNKLSNSQKIVREGIVTLLGNLTQSSEEDKIAQLFQSCEIHIQLIKLLCNLKLPQDNRLCRNILFSLSNCILLEKYFDGEKAKYARDYLDLVLQCFEMGDRIIKRQAMINLLNMKKSDELGEMVFETPQFLKGVNQVLQENDESNVVLSLELLEMYLKEGHLEKVGQCYEYVMIKFQTLECLENYASNVSSNEEIANQMNDLITLYFYSESIGADDEENYEEKDIDEIDF